MTEERSNQNQDPWHAWLPGVVLKLLVFLTFAFVIYEATVGLGEKDLSGNRSWVVVAGLAGLLLLLAVDRLTGLKVSPGGLEATLAEFKARAVREVGAMVEDPQVAETAQAQILQAQTVDQVQAAVAQAVELNVTRALEAIREAIRGKRKCYVLYRPVPDEPVQSYHVAPLDVRPGKSPSTKSRDYLWAYSYEHESLVSLRLDRVIGVELSEETFEPAQVEAPGLKSNWNVPREW